MILLHRHIPKSSLCVLVCVQRERLVWGSDMPNLEIIIFWHLRWCEIKLITYLQTFWDYHCQTSFCYNLWSTVAYNVHKTSTWKNKLLICVTLLFCKQGTSRGLKRTSGKDANVVAFPQGAISFDIRSMTNTTSKSDEFCFCAFATHNTLVPHGTAWCFVPHGTMWCFAAHLYLMALCGALQHTYAWSVVLCSTLVPHGTGWCFAKHLCLTTLCKTLVPHNTALCFNAPIAVELGTTLLKSSLGLRAWHRA